MTDKIYFDASICERCGRKTAIFPRCGVCEDAQMVLTCPNCGNTEEPTTLVKCEVCGKNVCQDCVNTGEKVGFFDYHDVNIFKINICDDCVYERDALDMVEEMRPTFEKLKRKYISGFRKILKSKGGDNAN